MVYEQIMETQTVTANDSHKSNLSLQRPWVFAIALIVAAAILGIIAILASTDGEEENSSSSDNNENPIMATAATGVSSNAEWEPYVQEFNGIQMVLVPAGCFTMGSTDEQLDLVMQMCDDANYSCSRSWFQNEQPAHEQCFDKPFWIDRTEVTRAQYNLCISDGRCSEPLESENSIRDEQPINRVTWMQALDYCEWRDARLPSEREWEYAARGPDSLIYSWGNEFVAEFVPNETADVGSYADGVSWVGAFDMTGNVWEWVSSRDQRYEYDGNDGREDFEDIRHVRVIRGGSQFIFPYSLRAASRTSKGPDKAHHDPDAGFRCAR